MPMCTSSYWIVELNPIVLKTDLETLPLPTVFPRRNVQETEDDVGVVRKKEG